MTDLFNQERLVEVDLFKEVTLPDADKLTSEPALANATTTRPNDPDLDDELVPLSTTAVSELKSNMDHYLSDAKARRLLTADQEIDYLRRAHAGEADARNKLISRNVRLVISIANNYRNSGLPLDDLVQEGILGLSKAIDKFDVKSGFRFSTYATWWIKNKIIKSIDEKRDLIRKPSHVQDYKKKIWNVELELSQLLKRAPNDQEVAARLDIEISELAKFRNIFFAPISIECPVDGEDSTSLENFLADENLQFEDQVTNTSASSLIADALLACLTPSQREIICRVFGISGFEIHTISECAESLGKTQNYVQRQILLATRAMRRLGYSRDFRELLTGWDISPLF